MAVHEGLYGGESTSSMGMVFPCWASFYRYFSATLWVRFCHGWRGALSWHTADGLAAACFCWVSSCGCWAQNVGGYICGVFFCSRKNIVALFATHYVAGLNRVCTMDSMLYSMATSCWRRALRSFLALPLGAVAVHASWVICYLPGS